VAKRKHGNGRGQHYEVIQKLGGGWEGEVYIIRERSTEIERAAKFFFPHRNVNGKTAHHYATKLHKLRNCPILIHYHGQETVWFRNVEITYLISEFVEGELLTDFIARQPGKRLRPFAAVHLLHALASGMEAIHRVGEYHGDLHAENVIVQRHGLGFDLKLIDLFHWDSRQAENIKEDVVDLVRIFYDALGGAKHYAKQPPEVKAICCGLKRSLILKKFKTAGWLKAHLEAMEWS
jgi:tRNA A-37 threonylcarbamoyl transferase component Bud32